MGAVVIWDMQLVEWFQVGVRLSKLVRESTWNEQENHLVTVGSPVYVSATNCPIFYGGQGVFFLVQISFLRC